MRTLLLMRHAKSSWADPQISDHNRPLNKRGKHDAPRMGRLLRQEDLVPDLIVTSTAQRALATASAVADQSGASGELLEEKMLYAADVEAYIEVLQGLPDHIERVLVVGHNPDMETLIEALSGDAETMPTASIAYLQLPINSWRDLEIDTQARLLKVWRPKEME